MVRKEEVKLDDNTPVEEIDILENPNTESLLFRYIFLNHWCKGKKVLDAACGHGIGTKLLKVLGAKSIVGFDNAEYALEQAEDSAMEGVSFRRVDLTKPTKKDYYPGQFDTVISVETLEHLPEDKADVYLQNLRKWCKKDGHILITTPRRPSDKWEYNGGTHLREYTQKEFGELIAKNFGKLNCGMLGIQEVRVGTQLVSVLTDDLRDARIMVAMIKNAD